MKQRSQRLLPLVAALTLVVVLGGCDPTREDIGTASGAVIGGVAGHAIFHDTLGTVGGAAAGALIGNSVGQDMDRRRVRHYHHYRDY